jgi:hypothetical protein
MDVGFLPPFGCHKGNGLALIAELLICPLVGSDETTLGSRNAAAFSSLPWKRVFCETNPTTRKHWPND